MAKKYVVIREKEDELEHGGWVKDGQKGFVPKGTPGAHPTGDVSNNTNQNQNQIKNETNTKSAEEKEMEARIAQMKKENEQFKVISEYNRNLNAPREEQKKANEERVKNTKAMLNEGQNITNNLSNMLQERRGSRRINPKETDLTTKRPYAEIGDDELNRRVRRMQLERQYGELSGDVKYEMTGKEKVREYLQTIGSILGIAGSAIGIYFLIKNKG